MQTRWGSREQGNWTGRSTITWALENMALHGGLRRDGRNVNDLDQEEN